MYLVGLTGGIASGKSFVASLLQNYGATVIDADNVAREVVLPGTTGLVQVVGAFGYEILLPSGELDRKKLGEIVFSDAEKRTELERILHPLIKKRTTELIRQQTTEIVVYAVPLLIEAKVDYPFNSIITVEAGVENQVARLVASRSISEAEARSRIDSQVSAKQRQERADFVIDNSGTKEETEKQVGIIWKQLVENARKVH